MGENEPFTDKPENEGESKAKEIRMYTEINTTYAIETLPVEKRIEIANQRGDDILYALIDDTYGSASIKQLWTKMVVEGMRELEAKAKEGDEEARKLLRTTLLMYMPSELLGSSGFIQGVTEASASTDDKIEAK